jgi:hypothetical protein
LIVWGIALLVGRRWWALAGMATTVAGMALVSTLIAGPQWLPDWIRLSRDTVNLAHGHGLDAPYSHNFRHLWGALTGGEAGPNDPSQLVVMILMALLTVAIWWRAPAGPIRSQAGYSRLALTSLTKLFTTPVLNTHDLAFLVVPAALLLAPVPGGGPAATTTRRAWAAFCWVGWALAWPAVALLLTQPIKLMGFWMLAMGIGIAVAWWRAAKAPASPAPLGQLA